MERASAARGSARARAFFFQAEDGIRDFHVTGVQTCALPISSAGARYLLERGAEPGRILMEAVSLDTIGNAYFSRLLHVIPREFRRVLVVTSDFHMPRTQARSEERRVGKECRSGWWRWHYNTR